MVVGEAFSLVDAEISDLRRALHSGAINSVDLVSKYLLRIANYDSNGPRLNSVCVLNTRVFEEAQASDDYRATSGLPARALEGIPFLVKDSFKVDQMTVAAGAPAFADLVASNDCAIVSSLRAAGAIVLGKTNMPAMADGGAQRGVYGRAESPYNPIYSTTAFASGSSSGSGTSVASSLAAFGFAGETVSSGRAPASNNALIGYSPSRGVIPIRGQWPLYPTCDVVVPHTRTMRDMFDVLNVIVADDPSPAGDFWRCQKFVDIPLPSTIRPNDYHSLAISGALRGKRIAIPTRFLGHEDSSFKPTVFSLEVQELFNQARADLEALGATLIETAFPLLDFYDQKTYPGQSANVRDLPESWNSIERCKFIAMGWDDFLRANGSDAFPDLTVAAPADLHPLIAPMDDSTLFTEKENHVRYEDMIDSVKARTGSLEEVPGCGEALRALECARKRDLEQWMDERDFDCLVFPTNGDVARADAEENLESVLHALQDGVKYSNGGRALKHLGVPAITVPMGTLRQKKMPVGLTFCGRGYSDDQLLMYAYDYENRSHRRRPPPTTPALPSDCISTGQGHAKISVGPRPVLRIKSVQSVDEGAEAGSQQWSISLAGTIDSEDETSLSLFIDGRTSVEKIRRSDGEWSWSGRVEKKVVVERYPSLRSTPKDLFLVMVIAKTAGGQSAGSLALV